MKEAEISVGGSIVAVADSDDCYGPGGSGTMETERQDKQMVPLYGSVQIDMTVRFMISGNSFVYGNNPLYWYNQ